MAKYIDADKVIDYANQEVTAAFYYPQCSQSKLDEDAYREKWAFVKKVMVAAPAVDVVEVVRCRECVMWDGSFTLNGQKKCLNMTFCTDGDFYCGYGSKE